MIIAYNKKDSILLCFWEKALCDLTVILREILQPQKAIIIIRGNTLGSIYSIVVVLSKSTFFNYITSWQLILLKFNIFALIGDVSLIKLGVSEEEYVHLSSEVSNTFISQWK